MKLQPNESILQSDVESPQRLFYSGKSMGGTFREGDYLFIEEVSIDDVRAGDVLVYRQSEGGESTRTKHIVHRAMKLVPGGIMMRGDGNPVYDVNVVRFKDVVGRVTHVERDGHGRTVSRGQRGLIRARCLHGWQAVKRTVWRLVIMFCGRLYRRLKNSGIACYVWRPTITKIMVNTPKGPLVKYVSKGRTIAAWMPLERNLIYVQRPYDLVLLRLDDSDQTRPPRYVPRF